MSRPLRLWFNRGFSLAPIAGLIRASHPDLDVFISVAPNAPRYPGPTAIWTDGGDDPATYEDADAYVAWVQATLVEHAIDLFIPTRRRAALAAANLPCRVHWPADAPTLALLEDKFAFAEAIKGRGYHLPTHLVTHSDELTALLANWPADAPPPCVKPQQGVNGLGFWLLTDVSPTYHLKNPDARHINLAQYLHAMRQRELERPIRPIVVMPFLPGPEVSIDILAHHGAMLKYAARTKLANGHQMITTSHPLAAEAEALVAHFALHGLVNAQFRLDDVGGWRLLEINARPAGGVVYADQMGCNLVGDWAGLMTGRLTPDMISKPDITCEVAFITMAQRVPAEMVAA